MGKGNVGCPLFLFPFRHGDNIVIVEAKGGVSRLGVRNGGVGQMSQAWINQQITKLRDRGYTEWANLLENAKNSNKLQGLVVKTQIKGDDVLDPIFQLKDWAQIGFRNF